MLDPGLTPQPIDSELTRFLLSSRGPGAEDSNTSPHSGSFLVFEALEESRRFLGRVRHFSGPAEQASLADHGNSFFREAVCRVLYAMQKVDSFSRTTILKILPHDLPEIKVDRDHLEILLFHLINYARRSLDGFGGMITIEAMQKIYLSPENTGSRRFILRVSHSRLVRPCEITGGFEDYGDLLRPLGDLPDQGALYFARKITEYHHGFFRVECSGRLSVCHLEFPV